MKDIHILDKMTSHDVQLLTLVYIFSTCHHLGQASHSNSGICRNPNYGEDAFFLKTKSRSICLFLRIWNCNLNQIVYSYPVALSCIMSSKLGNSESDNNFIPTNIKSKTFPDSLKFHHFLLLGMQCSGVLPHICTFHTKRRIAVDLLQFSLGEIENKN